MTQTQYDELLEDWKYTTVFHMRPLTNVYPSYTQEIYNQGTVDWCNEHFKETFGGLRYTPTSSNKDITYDFIIGDNDISKPNAVAFKLRWS